MTWDDKAVVAEKLDMARDHLEDAIDLFAVLMEGAGDHDTEVDLLDALNAVERRIRSARYIIPILQGRR